MDRNIFQMTLREFDEWLESTEGNKLIDNLVDKINYEVETDPYFSALDCWNWGCQYNSGHNKEVEMGEITKCHKFKWQEENDCNWREEIWWW